MPCKCTVPALSHYSPHQAFSFAMFQISQRVPVAWTKEALHKHLNTAVLLELYTIPLYLYAAYSIKPGQGEAHDSIMGQTAVHWEIFCCADPHCRRREARNAPFGSCREFTPRNRRKAKALWKRLYAPVSCADISGTN